LLAFHKKNMSERRASDSSSTYFAPAGPPMVVTAAIPARTATGGAAPASAPQVAATVPALIVRTDFRARARRATARRFWKTLTQGNSMGMMTRYRRVILVTLENPEFALGFG
jgi:hypothetical protein